MIEGQAFDNEHTVGETKALLAPLLQTTAESIHGYIVLYVGVSPNNEHTIGIVSNDEHPACRIGLLAKAIELIAHEVSDSDA